jgi:hypothetical protein
MTADDLRSIEVIRRDRHASNMETVGHAVYPTRGTSLCGTAVVLARPITWFTDSFLFEQWGPIRRYTECAAAFVVDIEDT